MSCAATPASQSVSQFFLWLTPPAPFLETRSTSLSATYLGYLSTYTWKGKGSTFTSPRSAN